LLDIVLPVKNECPKGTFFIQQELNLRIPGDCRFLCSTHGNTKPAVKQNPVTDLGGDRYPYPVIGYDVGTGILVATLVGNAEVKNITIATKRLGKQVGSCLVDVSGDSLLVQPGLIIDKSPLCQKEEGISLFHRRVLQPVLQL